jgi:hypothetical protein
MNFAIAFFRAAKHKATFSIIRVPNTPFRQTTTVSSAVTKLTKHDSIPAEPGAERAIVKALFVKKAYCNKTLISSIMPTNAGSKCPIVGLANAESTQALTSEGPGPINVRCGGIKELKFMNFP